MSGLSCGIVGAVAASIVWMFAVVWLMDQRDAAERRAQRWRETCYKLEIVTGGRKPRG